MTRLAALILACALPAYAEPVAIAQATHGGHVIIADRRGPRCPAGQFLALDTHPGGRYVVGCARVVRDGVLVQWVGWPGPLHYPRGAFREADRDLSWVQ